MTREKYESLPLATLKELAKARKMKGVSTLKKADLIEAMISLDEQEDQEKLSEQKESSQEHLKEMQNQNREEDKADFQSIILVEVNARNVEMVIQESAI